MSIASLADRLAQPPQDAHPVAWNRAGLHTGRDFAEQVEGLSVLLRARKGRDWLLDCTDSFACAVGLYAVARAEGVAWLAPNRQPGTLRELAAGCDGILRDGDGDGVETDEGVPVLEPLGHRASPVRAPLDPSATVLRLFTSGTTGQAKDVPKAWSHLDEVRELERRFGEQLPRDARVFATAPHQHLYGLLFRVLWPLAAGRPFQAESLLHVEELLPRMAEYDPVVLAATPVHLRRLCQREGLAELRGRVRAVFSSGGPLPAEVAAEVERALGDAPIEVFGSTETGGVAVRQQAGDAEAPVAWSPIGGVRVRRDEPGGGLRVTSPYVSVGAGDDTGPLEFAMGDRITLTEGGGFHVVGRADRIVKIGEKRLSLPDMESRLREHAYVSEAALVDVDKGTDTRVAAVIVPTAEGRAADQASGRRSLVAALGEHLAPHWDRVLLPKVWRLVDALPRDERGKLPRAALEALATRRPEGPRRLAEEREEEALRWDLDVPRDLASLEGHFPGSPIVPGVAQLGWAIEAAESLLGHPLDVRGVEVLKFKEVLLPGARATLEVMATADDRARGRVRFRITTDHGEASSGRIAVDRRDEGRA